MGTDRQEMSEADLRGRLEKLVEAEMSVAHLQAGLAQLIPDAEDRKRADALSRDLRDLLDRASTAAEADLNALRAERGLYPDD